MKKKDNENYPFFHFKLCAYVQKLQMITYYSEYFVLCYILRSCINSCKNYQHYHSSSNANAEPI